MPFTDRGFVMSAVFSVQPGAGPEVVNGYAVAAATWDTGMCRSPPPADGPSRTPISAAAVSRAIGEGSGDSADNFRRSSSDSFCSSERRLPKAYG